MSDKQELPETSDFNELPQELKLQIAQYLSNKLSNPGLLKLALASEDYPTFFKPLIDVRQLLRYVVRGEHEAVEAMLKKDMNLIFKRDKVTDCSGRKFENISAFEYVLWALDKHMWAAMMACIPQNEESRKIFAQLIAQYNKVNTDGVTYTLNEETITEQHFDFNNTLIKELQTQMDSINESGVKNWEAIDKQWSKGVGSAQKLLPMHVVYEYCSDEPFYPVPKFTSQPKSSKQFYNGITEKDENWFSRGSTLANDFAIYKSTWIGALASSPDQEAFGPAVVSHDLDAMTALCKVRTEDLSKLKSHLEECASLDNHHLTELTSCR